MGSTFRLLLAAMLASFLHAAGAQDATRLALGERVFNASCKACHDTGTAKNDAPQLSEAAEWKERLGKGRDEMYKNSIEGFTGYFVMPPRGGNPALSDDEVRSAVDYLFRRAGLP